MPTHPMCNGRTLHTGYVGNHGDFNEKKEDPNKDTSKNTYPLYELVSVPNVLLQRALHKAIGPSLYDL